ncbi:MAG TPA: RNA-binding protein [Thermoanaerobaculia bacterium]
MKIYIGNLPSQITDSQLNAIALRYGNPDSANVARRAVGGVSKGFGFVEYRTDAEGSAAIAGLNGEMVDGEALSVHRANKLEVRPWSAAGRKR